MGLQPGKLCTIYVYFSHELHTELCDMVYICMCDQVATTFMVIMITMLMFSTSQGEHD